MTTILIVDDDPLIREVARASLEVIAGWKVEVAESGPEALELTEAVAIDAILLDLMMPEMDGRSTLAALRADPATSDLPVIFLTARVEPAERRSLEELEVSGVLAKPFDPERLHLDVAATLGWDLENG